MSDKKMKVQSSWILILGIILMGAILRAPITGIGALVSMIREDLQISGSAAGMITTIPLLAFAVVSPFASGVARKVGFGKTLTGALVVLFIGGIIRSYTGAAGVFIGTAIMGCGIAFGNVLAPGIIKMKFPNRIGVIMGAYAVSMAICSAIALAVNVPLAQKYGLGWKNTLALWLVVIGMAFPIWLILSKTVDEKAEKRSPGERNETPVSSEIHVADKGVLAKNEGTGSANSYDESERLQEAVSVTSGKSVYKSSMAWWITLFYGTQSLLYYCFVAWLPTMILTKGFTETQSGFLATLNQMSGLPMSFFMPIIAEKMKNQKGLAIATGGVYFVGMLSLFLGTNMPVLILALCLTGIGAGSAMSLATADIALRAADGQQASDLSGMSQFIGYILAAVGPTLMGRLYDLSGTWTVSIVFMLVMIVVLTIAAYFSGRRKPV